ncbi:PREDICTED: acyl-coenzyme A synthetase ACSM4, mitochondrial-like isoform X5 [Crocodylus porosus]|uniref:acyl-coenzyme A synthetase ACSM4, mitochondrial-like isoform X5 n=1 Tax=Crocodylus porosus TaxID=8502 RepID=UPI00093CB8D2|nr:PREDICTED: acyl-coenzyme A synthetase ACSM4, mitochondrial-like isoform X5 [Crocodylus porosus]
MKILLKLRTHKTLWIPNSYCRSFHKDHKLLASEIFSHYEPSKRHEKEAPEYFNFASDVLDKWSQMEKDGKRPSNPAFWWINGRGGEERWSFEELGFRSRKVANMLMEVCGLQKGDRLIVILPRIPEWWLVHVACIRTGTILIPGTTQLTARDILYRLQASKAKCIITSDKVAPAVDSVASECQFLKTKLIVSEGSRNGWVNFNELYKTQPADHICVKTKMQDPVMIFFTSGTTGSPKMTEHTQGSLGFRPVISERYWLDTTPSDVIWCTADTGWIVASLGSVFDPWALGSCVFAHSLPQIEPTTILSGVICSVSKGMKIKAGSMGKAAPPFDVQIIDENAHVLPPGQEGEIAIRIKPTRPLGLFSKYIDNPEKTAAAERGSFYVTGDRGTMDKDGYFWFIGRGDDVIISSGYRIGPFEVESALIEHPAVAESAVVSSPDPLRGEVVKAFVVLSPAFTSCDLENLTLELQEHVKKVTAPYKYPRKMEFVKQLPKTVTGKIKRNELRNKEWRRM